MFEVPIKSEIPCYQKMLQECKIHLISNADQCDKILTECGFMEESSLGLDCEWGIGRRRFKRKTSDVNTNTCTRSRSSVIALLQLSSKTNIVLIHLHTIFNSSSSSTSMKVLKDLLENKNILKFGTGIGGDVKKLYKIGFRVNGHQNFTNGLKRNVANEFHLDLLKQKGLTCSDWEAWPLKTNQILYAAADAYFSLHCGLVSPPQEEHDDVEDNSPIINGDEGNRNLFVPKNKKQKLDDDAVDDDEVKQENKAVVAVNGKCVICNARSLYSWKIIPKFKGMSVKATDVDFVICCRSCRPFCVKEKREFKRQFKQKCVNELKNVKFLPQFIRQKLRQAFAEKDANSIEFCKTYFNMDTVNDDLIKSLYYQHHVKTIKMNALAEYANEHPAEYIEACRKSFFNNLKPLFLPANKLQFYQ